jgi:glycosyltransferase involved in cell wall biosynthesis
MLSTSGKGGMLSVVEGYQRDGLFCRWNVLFVPTHAEGSLLKKLACAARAYVRVAVLAGGGKISLLHCHVSMYGSFWRKSLFAMIGRFFGVDVLLHLHGSDMREFYDALPTFAKRMVVRQLTAATAVLVLSESWRTYIRSLAPEARIVVLPNYVELPGLATRDAQDSRIEVLFLGIIGERKGIYDLLTAFAAALRRRPELYLRIGGNGDVEAAKRFASGLGLGLDKHVEFVGWVSGDEKLRLLRIADIFVLPSYNEGLPVSVLEAMSWSVPVITTPVGGIPELVKHGINGLLVPPGDVKRLEDAMLTLAGDDAMRWKIGRAGRKSIEESFSRNSVLPVLESLYAESASIDSGSGCCPDVK